MGTQGARRLLLTFRLDQEQRQRLRARLAREGRTMSEVVTHGLRDYVRQRQHAPPGEGAHRSAGTPVLPDRLAARLRELRSSGRSDLLSAALAALNEAGWPLRPLAEALGISRQAVQARVRRRDPASASGASASGASASGASASGASASGASARGVSPSGREPVQSYYEPPPPFPHRREASAAGFRTHLTIRIDHALRAAAHRAAAREGSSLSQVVETILDRYVRHGLADCDQPAAAGRDRCYERRSTRIMRQASAAPTGESASKSP